MIPRVLKSFNLFVKGKGYVGIVDEVTPPKLTIKTEEYRAGGMDAPAEIDMGMEKLEASFSVSEHDADIYGRFGLVQDADVDVRFQGALHAPASPVVPVVIWLRGIYKELDGGSWKAGEKGALKATLACRYYRLDIDGKTVIEVDVDNMTRIINGSDQMAGIRAAIGI